MNKRGMTLIEVIISVVLVTIIAAGMFASFVTAKYIFNRERHRVQAFNFAEEAQARLRSEFEYADSEMDVGTGKPESNIGTILEGELAEAGFNAVLEYDVVAEPVGSTGSYKEVIVRVTWDEQSF